MRISDWSSDVCSSDLKIFMKAFRGIISKVKLGKIPFIISERKSTGKTHVPERKRRYQVARIGKSSVIHGINKHTRNIIFFCKQSLVGHRSFQVSGRFYKLIRFVIIQTFGTTFFIEQREPALSGDRTPSRLVVKRIVKTEQAIPRLTVGVHLYIAGEARCQTFKLLIEFYLRQVFVGTGFTVTPVILTYR